MCDTETIHYAAMTGDAGADELQSRLEERALPWRVSVEDRVGTATSIIAVGHRDRQPVVLQIAKRPS